MLPGRQQWEAGAPGGRGALCPWKRVGAEEGAFVASSVRKATAGWVGRLEGSPLGAGWSAVLAGPRAVRVEEEERPVSAAASRLLAESPR